VRPAGVDQTPLELAMAERCALLLGIWVQVEVRAPATTGPDLDPAPASETIPMIVIGVRLPSDVVRQLDQLAGNDKGGRSGLIRQAIDEFLQRHADEAA
jgi:Ribbon-helix-helix protein, copG family